MSPRDASPSPSFGVIERVIAALSPKRGAERMAQRLRLQNLRSYDAAARGRRTEGWVTMSSSADVEVARAGALLRDRMRDLVRNNPLAANAVNVLVTNIVGAGIAPRAKSGNKARDKRANEIWKAFAADCDADGRTNFDGLTALAVREMIEGGEIFALRRRRPAKFGKLKVPLQIELKEADHLDDRRFDQSGGARIEGGIEYAEEGRRAAYWLYPDHPGGQSWVFRRNVDAVRVSAENVIHLFERQRVQNRGVPWGAPVMRHLRDIDDWQVAELTRKKSEACMVGVVLGDDDTGMPGITAQEGGAGGGDADGLSVITDADGVPLERMEPGLFGYMRNGRDIKFNTPAATGGVYEWNRVQWHYISAGFRVPYPLLTGDLSQTNFSSSRVGLNDFRRMIEALQWHLIIPVWCQTIWDWCMDAAHLAGQIDRPDIGVEWAPPSFPSVNPLQDAQADQAEVRAGFASLPQMIAKRGYDPRETVTEQADFLKETDLMGLVFDSDPRRVAKSGAAQTQDLPAQDDGTGGDTKPQTET